MAEVVHVHPDLVDLVKCALCLERFNESDRLPKALDCLHTFCLECLENYGRVKGNKVFPCPSCRKNVLVPTEGMAGLLTNFMVINVLNHVPESLGPAKLSEIKPNFCDTHHKEKCDFFCDNCQVCLCRDCIVDLNKGPHRDHNIIKLEDVGKELDARLDAVKKSVKEMEILLTEKFEKLEKNVVTSREKLKQQANQRFEQIVTDAKNWLANTNESIDKDSKKLLSQIAEARQSYEWQTFQNKTEDVTTLINEVQIKDAICALETVEATEELKGASLLPPSQWLANLGSLSEFTLDMGHLTPPQLKLFNLQKIPPNSLHIRGIKLLSESMLELPCSWSVGLALTDAVVGYGDGTIKLKKMQLDINTANVLKETILSGKLKYNCRKYILNDDTVLIRDRDNGPSHILSSNLDNIATIQEDHGSIRGAYSKHWVAFTNKRSLKIVDLKKNQLKKTVKPPSGFTWSDYLSVCKHPDTDDLVVVVDQTNKILVIDNADKECQHVCRLEFLPRPNNSVSCSSRHIYAASFNPPGVHIYSWEGELVISVNREQLAMKGGYKVWNIAAEGDKFSIATGQEGFFANTVERFHAYVCV